MSEFVIRDRVADCKAARLEHPADEVVELRQRLGRRVGDLLLERLPFALPVVTIEPRLQHRPLPARAASLSNPPTLPDHVQLELPSVVGRGRTPSVSVAIANDTPDPLFVGAPEAVGAQVEWNHEGVTENVRQDLPVFVEPDRTLRLLFPADLSSRLGAAGSAELRVQLTGSVQLEATQTVRIVDLPTSLDRTGLSATLARVQIPPLVHANTVIPVEVTARNTGRSIWLPDPPATSGTPGVVGVSVRSWTGPDGHVLQPSANSTAHVQWNVNPGQAAVVVIHTSTPPVPGHYSLVLDMLSENVTWFDDVDGGARTVVSVDVEP